MPLAAWIDSGRLARLLLMALLGLLAVFIEAAPLGVGPSAPPSPDLLLCVVVYWSLRRPATTPLLAVFVLGLVRDMLTDVPVGAGALTLVLVAEGMKHLRRKLSRSSFLLEWLVLGGAALGSAATLWLLVVLTLAQPPYMSVLLHQSLYTIMIYPLLAAVFRWVLRIRWRVVEPA